MHNRFGVVVSNKSEEKSVRRHYWKRFFASELRKWPSLSEDFLVVVSPGIRRASKAAAREALEMLLEKIKNEKK